MEKRIFNIVFIYFYLEMIMVFIQFFLYYEDSESCLVVVKKIIENARSLIYLIVSYLFNIDCNFYVVVLFLIIVDKLEGKLLYFLGNLGKC